MDFRKVESFKLVAELQSITKAADVLHVSQPALSRTIHQIEKEVGAPLFDRVGRTIVLNENGIIFLRYANKAISAIDSARNEIAANQLASKTSLTLLPRTPLGRPGLVPSLFQLSRPDIHLKYIYSDESVPQKDFDIEVYGTFTESRKPDSIFITNEELCAVVSNDHQKASQ